jgi:hypothetical protein
MDRIAQYREIIEKVLTDAWEFIDKSNDQGVEYKQMFDRQRDSYASKISSSPSSNSTAPPCRRSISSSRP